MLPARNIDGVADWTVQRVRSYLVFQERRPRFTVLPFGDSFRSRERGGMSCSVSALSKTMSVVNRTGFEYYHSVTTTTYFAVCAHSRTLFSTATSALSEASCVVVS